MLLKIPGTMKRPRHGPLNTHCRMCGTQLEIEHPVRDRVRGLFDRRPWQANMVCPKCGVKSGGGWGAAMAFRHPPRNPILRVLFQLRHRRRSARAIAEMRRRNPFIDGDGRVNLAGLLAAVPFPVYGLKGRPLGLRLMIPGWGGRGTPETIDRIHFGYVAGHPSQPDKAVHIDQDLNVDDETAAPDTVGNLRRVMADLSAVGSLVRNYASKERRETYFYQGDFHRDWNQERLQKTPRRQAIVQAGGMDVDVQITSWDEPQRVILARLTVGGHRLLAASLNLSWEALQEALTTLVVLQEDQETLADYQKDLDEVRRERQEYHDKYLT